MFSCGHSRGPCARGEGGNLQATLGAGHCQLPATPPQQRRSRRRLRASPSVLQLLRLIQNFTERKDALGSSPNELCIREGCSLCASQHQLGRTGQRRHLRISRFLPLTLDEIPPSVNWPRRSEIWHGSTAACSFQYRFGWLRVGALLLAVEEISPPSRSGFSKSQSSRDTLGRVG